MNGRTEARTSPLWLDMLLPFKAALINFSFPSHRLVSDVGCITRHHILARRHITSDGRSVPGLHVLFGVTRRPARFLVPYFL